MQTLPSLSQKGERPAASLLRERTQGQADLATLSEVFAETVVDGAAAGFICAHLQNAPKPVLWIQDRLSRKEAGKPCLAGLPSSLSFIFVDVSKPVDVLWAMEEGLRCTGLSAVVGSLWGDPPALDFTATKRLALRAEARRLPCWMIRRAAHPNLSAARMRWRLRSLPSLPVPHDARAPGQALWQAELFRARWHTPGQWVARQTPEGIVFDHGQYHKTPDRFEAQA